MNFNTQSLIFLLGNLSAGHINYIIGQGVGKAGNLDTTEPSDIRSLDCSGFIQYVLYKSTEPSVRLIGGSTSQREWLDSHGYTPIDYSSNAPKCDDQVRIGFRRTIRANSRTGTSKKIGHVWLVINGRTYESTTKNGNNGPSSLLWSDRVNDVGDDFYHLGSAPMFQALKVSSPGLFKY